jgi:outer membrane protein OmpA-like peptidoglycan-associated protein
LALIAIAFGASMFIRRRNKAAAAVIAGAAAAATVTPAHAQETSTGFAINRYNPSERGSDWFVGESLDLRGHGRLAAGLILDWARKPLVSYDENGEELAAIIENQLYGHVGLSVNLWERLRLAASFPVLLYQNGTPVEYGGIRYATREGAEVGDLRLGADLRLLGEYGDAATLAIGAQVTLPTGTQDAYTSDGNVRFLPRAALAGDLGIFAYSAQAGLDYRGLRVDYAQAPFGTDMRFAATLGLRLADKALLLGPELWGSTVISDSGEGLFEEDSTPFEGIFGAHYFAGDWRFGAGVGPGFTRGLGAPALRVLASIEWFPAIGAAPPPPPPPLPPDTDGDGIRDDVDACVTVPGVASTDASKHGCPERLDTDKDGIFDDEDACVTDAGVASEDKEKHGCPPDQDGDGVLDRDDACVSEAGPKSDDPKKHGCPLPKDSDGDGIIDPEDACPDKAGPASDDASKHGCPRAEVSGERVIILDRIEFDTGKATIRSESTAILEAVRAVLEENPQIKKLRVEGHTDNRGGRGMNVGLSRRRAAAVVQWLVDNGINQERLTSQGLGPDKPVESNDSDTGRQNNRRVEFHIVDVSKPGAK